jgi:preprotein translocase subunit SecD
VLAPIFTAADDPPEIRLLRDEAIEERFGDLTAANVGKNMAIVLDGTPYATDSMMRCPCGLIVVHYRDPDVRGAGSRSAHGLRLDTLAPITNARSVPACELNTRSTQ